MVWRLTRKIIDNNSHLFEEKKILCRGYLKPSGNLAKMRSFLLIN